jgi:cytochrome c biogenesis protein CcmG/thiol:disulfide interchange protein DsbE
VSRRSLPGNFRFDGTFAPSRLVRLAPLAHNEYALFNGMRRSFIFVLAIVLALAGLAIGIAKVRPARARLSHTKTSAAPALPSSTDPDQARIIRFASNPQVAPAFLATDLDGETISTADWKGKVVLLNFWATWCPPCRAEIPMLIQLKDLYKDRLVVVGVSLDDDPVEDVKKFAASNRFNYPVIMATRELITEYGGVPALPTTFVINPDGKVVQKHIGLYRSSVYEGEIRALLGLPVDATIETFEDTGQIFLKNADRATELPDVDFTGLTQEQRTAALKRLNSSTCTCNCNLTLAQCRINDTNCPISKGLAAKIVAQISGKPQPVPAHNSNETPVPSAPESPDATPPPAPKAE